MKAIPLSRPEGYDDVARLIDTHDWTIGEMLFHVMHCLDQTLESTAPQMKTELLKVMFHSLLIRHDLVPRRSSPAPWSVLN